jgi:hypothetical protein
MWRLAGVAIVAAAVAAPCQAEVRKCTDGKGNVTYQDARCPNQPEAPKPAAATPAAVAAAPASVPAPRDLAAVEFTTRPDAAHGAWRGPALFHLKQSGNPPEARTNASIELDLLPDGRVRGVAAGAGCRFDGMHTPYEADRIVSVDITVSGCNDTRFNARYAGQLNAKVGARQSRLGMHAIVAASPISLEGFRDLSMVTIDAVLRR